MSNTLKIMFVAGGTGGHILPAVSLGDWIRENNYLLKSVIFVEAEN